MPDITKRMNFFDRQFLRARDFQDEQAYHLDRRRRHGGGLHGSGVVDGLNVIAGGAPGQVTIEIGWALDPLGREIVLAVPRANVATGGGGVEVWIAYPDPEPFADPSSDPGVTGFTRVNEEPVVTVVPPGTQPANGILLAKVSAGAPPIDNGVRTLAGVKDRSITEPKLADGAVSTLTIQDEAVTSAKLQSAANDAQDAQRAVTANHIRNSNVTEPKLAAGSVTGDKIVNGALTEPKLAGNAVSTRTIQDNAVTAAKIADGSVGTAEMATGAVTGDKIADNGVTTAKIANGAVTQPKVAPGAVSLREMKATVAAEGTLTLAANASELVPSAPLKSGFYIPSIFITDPPQAGVELRIHWQEEYAAFMGSMPLPPPMPPRRIPVSGRQWRISNATGNQVNVAFKLYRIDEA